MSTSFQSTRPVIVDSELPAQSAATNGKALISNGVTSSWNTVLGMIGTNQGQTPPAMLLNAILPTQVSQAGKVLTSDGTNTSWQPVGTGVTSISATAATGSTADLVNGTMAGSDKFRIRIGGAADAGYAEIATADNGTEPIYVRQYQISGGDPFAAAVRTATLLDNAGNTSFPGTVLAQSLSLTSPITINGSSWSGGNLQFYDAFVSGQASPSPTSFPSNTVRGFDAYSSTDFPSSHFTGITITGPGGVRSAQLAINWNTEESAPTAVYVRTNDDTATTAAWSSWQRLATAADIAAATASALPAGIVMHFANSTAPAGWLEANGAAVSRTTYAALFAAIGTTYGVGDGSTTFNVPDLRGEFIRSLDKGRGVDTGRILGSYQADEFRSHNHTFSLRNITNNSGGGGIDDAGGTGLVYNTNYTGGSETRPRNIALLACIKY